LLDQDYLVASKLSTTHWNSQNY